MKNLNKKNKITDFELILNKNLSRRKFIKNGISFGLSSFVLGASLNNSLANNKTSSFDFQQVKTNTLDTVTIPENFTWQTVIRWGDPMWTEGEDFNQYSRGDAISQKLSFGDNNDGMHLFKKGDHNILVVNNEYTNQKVIYGNRNSQSAENIDDINKAKAAHGISIVELSFSDKWEFIKDSKFNRRITADTPMEISGYAKGHKLLKTSYDKMGTKCLGTLNNCGNGKTPWGTYLTCEENFNGYFSSKNRNMQLSEEFIRYGIGLKDWGYNWANYDERFDISIHPNETNKFGYIVEIDPTNPDSVPRKLTSLGRFKHENAELVINKDNRVVIYMGDDERGEFLYKFISNKKYSNNSNNKDLLNSGKLYVAKFNEDNTGEWIELNPKTTGFESQAEICIYTRIAASKVGATSMDRPEWVAVNPNKAEVYCSLTNNKNRGIKPNKGGDPSPIAGPNNRKNNIYGQIVRWSPKNDDHSSNVFEWDLFAMAGNPQIYDNSYAGSKNINTENMFNSPDGLSFNKEGVLFIQTDGKYTNEGKYIGMGNNQMLCGNPITGEIKRFLVGPRECEVTGITWSQDCKTIFVGIQHPGEKGNSNFPEGGNYVPRSSVIAIRKKDGSEITFIS